MMHPSKQQHIVSKSLFPFLASNTMTTGNPSVRAIVIPVGFHSATTSDKTRSITIAQIHGVLMWARSEALRRPEGKTRLHSTPVRRRDGRDWR
ncbi:hypothetical protein CDAR_568621 [Caerostris darwini]|uniref:Uncharacterized protein n=1 Tax=Caerostris darwini TaxID=1538125 RepID=A0AAV4VV58_9ARAC|nr:hypothetical protein CDAR_568621 [Caerostris darwini]